MIFPLENEKSSFNCLSISFNHFLNFKLFSELGTVVKSVEKWAGERGYSVIDAQVVKQSREEMIEKRGAMFPFLKKFINREDP